MGAVASRESFFQTGFDVLADLGYGGLKLAEVCQRLGVTTGSFYHYFASWSVFTRELVDDWQAQMTGRVAQARAVAREPRDRIDHLMKASLTLPHGAEAAIRVWGAIDPHVHEAQATVDTVRYEAMCEAAVQVLGNHRQAEVFSAWSVYLLVGYEQAILPKDIDGLSWLVAQLLDALDAGRFSTVPGRE